LSNVAVTRSGALEGAKSTISSTNMDVSLSLLEYRATSGIVPGILKDM
jgi:hypothetical protein